MTERRICCPDCGDEQVFTVEMTDLVLCDSCGKVLFDVEDKKGN